MEKKLYSVTYGPVTEGKPERVDIVVADSFLHLIANTTEDYILSIQLLPDRPVIL